jgi:ferredoxin
VNPQDKKYRIRHDRPNCIGCNACAAIAPKFWEMSDLDGRSDIIGSKMGEDGWEEIEILEEDLDLNQAAAESCPVNVIHLIRIGDNKQLI